MSAHIFLQATEGMELTLEHNANEKCICESEATSKYIIMSRIEAQTLIRNARETFRGLKISSRKNGHKLA